MKINKLFRQIFSGKKKTITVSEREAFLIRAAEAEARGQFTLNENDQENLPPTGLEISIHEPKSGRFKPISNQSGISFAVDGINERMIENELRQQRENRAD